MEKGKDLIVESGSITAPESFYIQVTATGPYLVYGNPPLQEESIVLNEEGMPWEYKKGKIYNSSKSPMALCRCGYSKNKPFCDGSHLRAIWNPKETASKEPLLNNAEIIEGATLMLADNNTYCAFVRFCDAFDGVWNLVESASTKQERNLVIHEVSRCASGRLVLFDKSSNRAIESSLKPSISVLEDPQLLLHGALWIKGGIKIISADGITYEVRNRVTLCRCGKSDNKPFCDGSHAEQ